MKFTPNPAGIAAILNDPAGPLSQHIERKAQELTHEMQEEAATVLWRVPRIRIEQTITYTMRAPAEAVVGVLAQERLSVYLQEKAERERVGGWLVKAVRTVFPN